METQGKIKYKTEAEFVEDVMPLILGGLIDGTGKIHCYAEVPRSSHNNHSDILLIKSRETMIIEFKLNDYKGLVWQIGGDVNWRANGMSSIGIINKELSGEQNHGRIFSYTGKDKELDRIIGHLVLTSWTDAYENNLASIYYWAYKGKKDDIKGGIQNGERISFYEVYMLAIKNLLATYKGIDFYMVYRVLGFYSKTVARKYYNAVLKDNFDIYKKIIS